jgi:hypothetical protein
MADPLHLVMQVWTRGGWLTVFFFGLIGAAVCQPSQCTAVRTTASHLSANRS